MGTGFLWFWRCRLLDAVARRNKTSWILYKNCRDSCEHFSIIDQNIVWYGNINILGNAKFEDSMMRLESKEIAAELMEITFGEKPI